MRSRLARLPAGRRTKWLVLIAWLVLLMAGGALGGKLQGATQNNADAYLPGSAEATRVIKLQDKVRQEDSMLAVVSYERRSGITPQDRAAAQAAAAKAGKLPHAGPVVGPLTSKDGQAMQILLPFTGDGSVVLPAIDDLREIVKRGPPAGLDVHVTGPGGSLSDLVRVFGSIDGPLVLVTLAVVIVMLLLTYRSPFLWLVPVVCAGAAYTLSQGVVYLLAEAGLTVSGQSTGILAVLVFGAGTDYALLIIARYREELHRHQDKHEAMAVALRRAGPAVLASSATVIIGLLCLLIAELNSTSGLGPVGAAGIVCALAAMTTLLPALLVALPRRVFWPVVPRYDVRYVEEPDALEKEHGIWARAARFVSARPRVVWVSHRAPARRPVTGAHVAEDRADLQRRSVRRHAGLRRRRAGHRPALPGRRGQPGSGDRAGHARPSRRGRAHPGRGGGRQAGQRAAVTPSTRRRSRTRRTAGAARDTVDRLRTAVHPLGGKVGGATAINLDTQRAAVHDNKAIIPIVLAVVFLILVLLLRAVVAPLLLMATVVLSFAASLGVCGLVFTHLFGFEGADSGFPLTIFIFLVALGVDYNIFLMTRVREESQRLGTRHGVLRGLTVTGGVITSAGLVLAATFAALATLPLTGLVEMAFAVAFGVLLDTLVVRSLLVPALAYDLGARIWWPGTLARAGRGESEPRIPESVG